MAQSIVCGGCGAQVAYGRLSCPECGEMLASVAGAARRPSTVATASWSSTAEPAIAVATPTGAAPRIVTPAAAPPPPAPPVLHEAEMAVDPWPDPVATGQLATWPDEADAAPRATPSADLTFQDEAAPIDAPTSTASADAVYAASLAAVRQSAADAAPATVATPAAGMPPAPTLAAPAPADDPEVESDLDLAADPAPAPSTATSWVATVLGAPVTDPVASRPAAAAVPMAAAASTPGAYVPPVLQAAGAPAPARAWAGQGGAATMAAVAATSPAVADSTDASTSASGSIDRAKAAEFVGWLAIAGSALALVGFLLPWSSTAVIGADGIGYFDRWGFAGPGHLVVVIGLVGVLAAAILRDRVPAWLGIGLPGIGLGALLIGLLWPYLIGPLGGALGAMAVALGAAMLVGAGIAAIVVDRHGGDARPV